MVETIRLRGRYFDQAALTVIKQITTQHYEEGRSAISRKICTEMDWRQPNGWLKDRACRDVLLHLNSEGIITLPPPKSQNTRVCVKTNENDKLRWLLEMPLIENYFKPEIKMVKGTRDEIVWNKLVRMFHYQGYSVIVGNSIKYIAYFNKVPVACIGWGSAAWSVDVRDKWLNEKFGWNRQDVLANLPLIINNVRYLILPWVKVKNLASTILAMMEKLVKKDWNEYYNIEPILLETFVEKSKFRGTCYKAANWINIGSTKGNAKKGNSWIKHNNIKDVFIRPIK